ncbi:hypothetical protein [Actinoplanes sp. NPDC049802]|uniref:hypothetical protein n=1 Tax=Actinoplanes sp. NPDC049802 TaxID=3154742 RepID=UPI0033E09407
MPERTTVVNAVDWPSLLDAHGAASDVPAALHAIWSDDADLRRRAYQFLVRRLVHQGSRFPASAAAVPFLIDVVADVAAPDRFAAVQLLRMIAIGDERYWLTELPDPAVQRDEAARRARLSLSELEAEHAAWVAAADTEQERRARETRGMFTDFEADRDAAQWDATAYDAVRTGVAVFVAALDSADPAVRLHTTHLLAFFPEARDTVVPALTRLVRSDADPVIASAAAVATALAGATAADSELIDALEQRRAGATVAEQWAAALAVAWIVRRPQRAVLEQVYACLVEAVEPVLNWPFLDGDMSGLAALTVGRLDASVAPERVDVLAVRLRETPPDADRGMLVPAMLDAAFPDGGLPAGTTFARLNGMQQTAVRAFAYARVWNDGPAVQTLLKHCGLPEDLPAWIRA